MNETDVQNQDAVEKEIARWIGFAKVLRRDDKEAFDEAMNAYRRFSSGSKERVNLAAFEQMILSITTGQMSTLNRIEARLNQTEPPKPEPSPEKVNSHPNKPMIAWHKSAPKKAQRILADFR